MCTASGAPQRHEPTHACQHSSWHPIFHRHALRTITIELPTIFTNYLLSDGVYVGDDSVALPLRAQPDIFEEDEDRATWGAQDEGQQSTAGGATAAARAQQEDDTSDLSSECSASTQKDWTELFPDLHTSIQQAIEELGGQVVPKLNWSCPSDATWVNPLASLACSNADQVVLMLKSSDRAAHDLDLLQQQQQQQRGRSASAASGPSTQAAGAPAAAAAPSPPSASAVADASTPSPSSASAPLPVTLVLKKWYDLRPEREFRCFVVGCQLVGVSQRDVSQRFPQLTRRDTRVMGRALLRFHNRYVRGAFPLDDYTYDVYIATTGTIKILDFNPIGGSTSPLLFEWQELGLAPDQQQHGGQPAQGQQQQQQQHQGGADGAGDNSSGSDASSSTDSESDSGTSEGDESGSSSGAGSAGARSRLPFPFRLVEGSSQVQPGQRAACAMPFDMLMLQETVEGMVRRMQG